MGKYFQEEIETASREKIEQIQTDGLLDVVKRVYENVPFYRKKMVEKGVTPDDIKSLKDISKLPFLTKDDLRDAYPYGLLAVPLKNCVRIHSTSGTTGNAINDNDVNGLDNSHPMLLTNSFGKMDVPEPLWLPVEQMKM